MRSGGQGSARAARDGGWLIGVSLANALPRACTHRAVWDIRKFTSPLGAVSDLANDEDRLDAVFSPDERFLVTGRATRNG